MYWFVGIVIGLVLLLQLPLLVDLLRVILPGRSITRLTNRITSLLLVYFMNIIFAVVLGYFLLIFLPLTVGDLYSIKGACHIAFALWLWLNCVVNYYYAVFLHPGETPAPQPHSANVKSGGDNESPVPRSGMEWQPKISHFCRNCRVHVSYMDHHCPFTNNCVGERNYSHFVVGLTYGTVGLAYAVAMSFPAFRDCVLSPMWTYLRFGRRSSNEFCSNLSVHSMIFFAAFAGLLSISFMALVQWALVLTDVPTCEVMKQYGRGAPVLRFMWQRLVGKKFLEPSSRLNVLLLKQRPNLFWFLLPVRNNKPKSE